MITDYEVITATHVAGLQERVRERIKSGWQPIGGIAVVHEEDAASQKPHMFFAQSLVSVQDAGVSRAQKTRRRAA